MKINLKPLLIWIFPVFISFFFELFFTDFKWYNLKNLIENLLVLGFILIVVSLFSNRFKFKIDKLAYIIFSIIIITESAYYYIFNSFFTSSVIYIVLETNYMEVTEFIGNYMSIELLMYLLITSSFALFFSLKSYESVFIFSSLSKPFLKIILLASIFIVLFTSKLYYFNFPFQVVKGTIEYVQEIKKYESFDIQNSYGNFKNVEFEGSTEDHTFVLIIGESTTRHQLGIYDFYRPTTPYLSENKEELLIYKDVISSESHTIESLQSALSLNNFTKNIESTIIQLMNQAGFKTFWLSNQPPIGIYDTLLTKVAKASDTEVFTNWSHYGIETPYDEVLLPYLDSALMDTANRKFIVIHLLATHGIYKLRHPKEFEVFTDIPDTNFKSESNFEKINSYHNSILYVDFIVNQVIEKVKAQQDNSYVIYLSDHGEEVYKDINFSGHNLLDYPTPSLYEIPFIVWLSQEYQSNYSLDFNAERPYSISNLLHSMSDLSKVNFEKRDLTKSIFSKEFKPTKRIISKGFDFDQYFKND